MGVELNAVRRHVGFKIQIMKKVKRNSGILGMKTNDRMNIARVCRVGEVSKTFIHLESALSLEC